MPTHTVVALDLDGTLTRRDTLLPFLCRAVGRGRTYQALLARSLLVVRSMAGWTSRDHAKEAVLRRLLRGQSVADLERAAEAFAAKVVSRGMRPEMTERIRAHRRAGHDLVIVSASPEIYVRPLARRLQIDTVLATRLEVDESGRLTGRLEGANCRGSEKVVRLRDWLGPHGTLAWAYGNSRGDRELLALADQRVHVGHGRRLPPLVLDTDPVD
ncbi:MAG: HAD-IB family hydrolase [Actinomycetota bacterium]|nr:HAD-IB family hydrolase [Actinomycetota bacterium]